MTFADQPVSTIQLAGRNRITERALRRVTVAVAAESLHVEGRFVSAELADEDGMLAVSVRAALPVASVAAIEASPSLLERTGGNLLERCERAQRQTKERVEQLTGRRVSRVDIRLTDARMQEPERVR